MAGDEEPVDFDAMSDEAAVIRAMMIDTFDGGTFVDVAGKRLVRFPEKAMWDVFSADGGEWYDALDPLQFESAQKLRMAIAGYPYPEHDPANWGEGVPTEVAPDGAAPDGGRGVGREIQ